MNQESHGQNENQSSGSTSNQQKLKHARKAYQEQVKKDELETTQMPKVDLNTFVLSMSSSVLVHLGEIPDPDTEKINTNLELARHTIDILGMLEEKTRGNLTQDEDDLLKNVLFELRMKYVQNSK